VGLLANFSLTVNPSPPRTIYIIPSNIEALIVRFQNKSAKNAILQKTKAKLEQEKQKLDNKNGDEKNTLLSIQISELQKELKEIKIEMNHKHTKSEKKPKL